MMRPLLSLLLTTAALAFSFPFEPAGGTALPFLKTAYSARAQGLGGAGAAFLDDGAYATLNPALINLTAHDRIYLGHMNLQQDMKSEFLSATFRYGAVPLGLSLHYLDRGKAPITTDGSDYSEDNTFGTYDAVAALTGGYVFGRFKTGLTAKFLHEAVWDRSVSGVSVDLGVQAALPVMGLSAGAALLNLGRTSAFIGERYPVTSTFRLGTAYTREIKTGLRLAAAADLNLSNDGVATLPFGLEAASDHLSGRAGWHLFHNTQTFSAGFSLSFLTLLLDYCYTHFTDDLSEAGQPHYFALSLLI